MDGFLELVWHPGHDDRNGVEGVDVLIPLADRVRGGQFGFFFCSVACIRAAIGKQLDELEMRIARGGDE
jgi:hypothetical protein